ncbi:MAG: glycolate oxidase subunit GlcF, partial [Betaproteobacteria bacterium]|nr:glycolate oxidase subunit GlcF [Betaproteobacteria bacterium]
PAGEEAEAILRKCVHCGFCTATCPTYQLLGDELDGPRGRIYLIKQVLEGAAATAKTQLHLDRCLTCRSCETTCPSGVHYNRLLDIGREVVEQQVGRGVDDTLQRAALRKVVPKRAVLTPLVKMGQLARPLLPRALKQKVPPRAAPSGAWPQNNHARKMLALESCGQPAMSPATNAAAARVLDRLGISLTRVTQASCCGALSFHLNAQDEARNYMRRNIDAWWPHLEAGAENIVSTASGCGVMVQDYAHALARDAAYAEKAKRVSELACDISDVIATELPKLKERLTPHPSRLTPKIAFHPPCTLQHGMKKKGHVETLLTELGFTLTPVPDAHLCCGSAGTYSILQPALARQLQANKIKALESGTPQEIVTANIGCQSHLQAATRFRVRHWIELLDEHLP